MTNASFLSILAHATPTPTSRSKGQKSKSRAGGILWRPPSRTACYLYAVRQNVTESYRTEARFFTLKSPRMSLQIIAARSGRFNRETESGRQCRVLSQRSSSTASTAVSQLPQPLHLSRVAALASISIGRVFVWPVLRAHDSMQVPHDAAATGSQAFMTRAFGTLRHSLHLTNTC